MINLEYLRSFRIYNIAIFDVVISYLGIYLLSPILIRLFKKFNIKTTKKTWMWLMFPISVIVHLLFSQDTTLIKMVLAPDSFYLIKALLILMVIIGLKK